MKFLRIVGLSLGSSKRNHSYRLRLGDQDVEIVRMGVDGDIKKIRTLISEVDGKVDCIGFGGMNLKVCIGHREYFFREPKALFECARQTPIVDGSGIKKRLEPMLVDELEETIGSWKNKRVVVTCAVDRFFMAKRLQEKGANVLFGDLAFEFGIPIFLKRLSIFENAARVFLPLVCQMPQSILNPVHPDTLYQPPRIFQELANAEFIVGDFHSMRPHLPQDLSDKTILTNTMTSEDVKSLFQRGAKRVIATTPNWNGRNFGTNVVEAVAQAVARQKIEAISDSDWNLLRQKLNLFADVRRC
jgi:hypothetical protein